MARHILLYLPRQLWLLRILKQTAKFDVRGRKLIVLLSSDTEYDPPSGNGTWTKRSTRGLIEGLSRFLDLCDRFNIPATFFCEGKLAVELPELIHDLAKKHEVGCHSFAHEWLGTRPPPRWIQRRDELAVLSTVAKAQLLRLAAKSIEDTIGKKPRSFKAPFNSVDHPSTLALLNQIGFDTDSSLPSYNNESLLDPLQSVPPHHVSTHSLWAEGEMRLIEVPFMVRPRPLFFHPFDVREEVVDTVSRSMKLALEGVDIQCRIDWLLGKDSSVVHITSHPWEFSEIRPWGRQGQANADRLARFLNELSAVYDVEFLTVSEFTRIWEKKYCPQHSEEERHPAKRHSAT